jgi:hypothetical protein
MEDRAIVGMRITSVERGVRRSKKGRVCREDGCETALSVYNDTSWCSLHAPMIVPRTRGKKLSA